MLPRGCHLPVKTSNLDPFSQPLNLLKGLHKSTEKGWQSKQRADFAKLPRWTTPCLLAHLDPESTEAPEEVCDSSTFPRCGRFARKRFARQSPQRRMVFIKERNQDVVGRTDPRPLSSTLLAPWHELDWERSQQAPARSSSYTSLKRRQGWGEERGR